MRILVIDAGNRTDHELCDGTHLVGSASDCDLRIPNRRVSRHHADFRVEGEELHVRDRGSLNGTQVDGQLVSSEEVPVPQGVPVLLGDVIVRRASDSDTGEISWRGIPLSPASGLQFGSGSAEVRDRILGMLTGLFELLATGGSARSVGKAVCEFCSRLLRADRVVILLRREAGMALEPLAGWPRMPGPDEDLGLSATIRDSVLEERRPLRIPTVRDDPHFKDQRSCQNLSTAMMVPLFDNRRTLGLLYADSGDSRIHFSQDDLDLLTTVANAAAIRLRWILIEGELATASRIQRAMEPRKLPEIAGYDLFAHQRMCHEVGGDLYQCLERPEGTYLLALGDVAGKGIAAALAMGACAVLLDLLAEVGGGLETLLQLLHRHLYAAFMREQFLTLFLAELSPASGLLRYVNAGHPAARVVRRDGGLERLESTGLPVGALEELWAESREIRLAPGDLLAIFSDGIPEATVAGDEFLGEDVVDRILAQSHMVDLTALSQELSGAVEDFVFPESPSDDVTLMLLRRRRAGEGPPG